MADKVGDATKGAQDKVGGLTSGLLGKLEAWGNWLAAWGKGLLDKIFPPEKRAAFLAKLQAFMLKNPKLSTFLGMNFAITGVPLFLFVLFSLTVFIFALVVGLLLGLLGAVAFTLFAVGVALTIVLPTVFFTTMAATFLFLWGLGGYYILKWANGEGSGESGKQEGGPSIGDRLNSLTGGRLSGFMSAAKDQEAKKGIGGFGDEHTPAKSDEKSQSTQQNGKTEAPQKTSKPETNGSPKPKPKANGSPAPQKAATDASNAASNTGKKATDAAGGATGGAQKAVGNAAGTATGGLSAATGTG